MVKSIKPNRKPWVHEDKLHHGEGGRHRLTEGTNQNRVPPGKVHWENPLLLSWCCSGNATHIYSQEKWDKAKLSDIYRKLTGNLQSVRVPKIKTEERLHTKGDQRNINKVRHTPWLWTGSLCHKRCLLLGQSLNGVWKLDGSNVSNVLIRWLYCGYGRECLRFLETH